LPQPRYSSSEVLQLFVADARCFGQFGAHPLRSSLTPPLEFEKHEQASLKAVGIVRSHGCFDHFE
jgi:hypothetical protein